MSEKPPSTPESVGESHEEVPSQGIDSDVVEKLTVPPTPEAPHEEIEARKSALADGVRRRESSSNEPAQTVITSTPNAKKSFLRRSIEWSGNVTKAGGVGMFGIFTWFFIDVIWHAIKHAPSMAGGGHKPSGGGGHGGDSHGGGHH